VTTHTVVGAGGTAVAGYGLLLQKNQSGTSLARSIQWAIQNRQSRFVISQAKNTINPLSKDADTAAARGLFWTGAVGIALSKWGRKIPLVKTLHKFKLKLDHRTTVRLY
jgi:hypothetical protein